MQGQALQNYGYDLAGNLVSKTGLGAYTYPAQGAGAIRPHATQSVAAIAGTFSYDGNGNLLSGDGRTVIWTGFDMPSHIEKNGITADFRYGPEHQRTSQTRGDGTTVVYAGAQEVELKSGVAVVKTYWPNAIGVEIDRGAAPTEFNWTHVDRLGSPVVLTDDAGAIREKLEYDVWGKRRSTADNTSTPDSLDGQTDNRGFTGHEMLDQLDLVHMNGRVYNPLIGRFLSADPLVGDPVNGQSYNRYAYVLNNPTNLTDPTGYLSMTAMGGGEWKTQSQFSMADMPESGSSGGGVGTSTEDKTKVQAAASTRFEAKNGETSGSANTEGLMKACGRSCSPNDGFVKLAEHVSAVTKNDVFIKLTEPFLAESGILGLASVASKEGAFTSFLARLFSKEEVIKGGIGPVLKGEEGVAKSIAAAEARGENVLGKEITMQTKGGKTRPDLLVRDANGNLKFIESKCGNGACLNPNQAARYPELQQTGGIPRGQNAANAGLTPGKPIGPTPVQVDYWP